MPLSIVDHDKWLRRLQTIIDTMAPGTIPDGPYAPLNKSFVVIANDADLTAERALEAGAGLTLSDGGVNANVSIAVAAADTSLTINANDMQVRLATNPGLEVSTGVKLKLTDTSLALGASGVGVNLAAASGLAISSGLMLDDAIAGAGLAISAAKVLSVGATDTSIAVGASAIGVNLAATSGLAIASGLKVGAGAGLTVNANDVALTTPGTLTVSSTNVATGNHTHAITASDDVSAGTTALLKSNAGALTLATLNFGADVSLNRYAANEMGFAADDGFRVADYAIDSDGYRVTGAGHGYFKYLYATEFHAKAFIADLEQALAGGQLITKSVAPLAADFTAPAASATADLVVQEFQGFGSFHVFVDGDFVRIREFSRSGSSLTIGDCWGTVVYASRDATNQTQTYTFTRSAAPNAGSMTATTVVPKGTLALDYGTTGNGFIESVAQSGAMASGVPYQQIVTWATHPNNGQTVRTRIGNLNGSYGIVADYFGIGLGNYATNDYLRYDSDSGNLVLKSGVGGLAIDAGTLTFDNGFGIVFAYSGTSKANLAWTHDIGNDRPLIAINSGLAGTTYGQIQLNARNSDPGNTSLTVSGITKTVTITNANTTLSGTLAVNGAAITTDDTTFALLNATATTINAFGAATVLNLGAASLVVNGAGGITINGGIAANDDITIQGTSHATRTTSYVLLQPNGGNVGIGTMGPAAKLHAWASDAGAITDRADLTQIIVEGASNVGIQFQSGSTGVVRLLFSDTGAEDAGVIAYLHSTDSLAFYTASAARMEIGAAGAVRFHAYGAGTLITDASGNITASSDERLKHNITPFRRGLAEVLAVSPIAYQWTPKSGLDSAGIYVGFSAQSVQAIIPEAVGGDSQGYLTLQDRPLLATLWNAVREQQAEIADLRAQLARIA